MEAVLEGAAPYALTVGGARSRPIADLAEPLENLVVRGLTSIYPGTGRGIEDVGFNLRRGGLTVITGEVGAGKTTLIRALIGLIPIQSGEILWNGAPVADAANFMIPPRCAYTAQAPRLFTESLRDNLLMGLGETDGAVTRAITLAILDDASSALDVRTEQLFWSRLLASGAHTCLVVSHRPEAFRRADEIILLNHGRVEARGTLESLLETNVTFRQTWHDITHAGEAR